MSDDTRDKNRRFVTIPGHKGRVKILLSKRPVAAPPPPSAPERHGPLPPTDAEDELIPPTQWAVTVHDLDTRLQAGAEAGDVSEYRELDYTAPVQFDPSAVPYWAISGVLSPEQLPFPYAGTLYVDEADLGLRDARLLSLYPLGRQRIPRTGRKAPNALAFADDNFLGAAFNVRLYGPDGRGYLVAGHAEGSGDPNPDWRWAERRATGEDWALSNTENDLAPRAGKYVSRKKHGYVRAVYGKVREIVVDDQFYRTLDTRSDRLTTGPTYDSPATHIWRVKFLLRVFLVRALHSVYEAASVWAISSVAPYWAMICERGLHFAAGYPVIPGPMQIPSGFLARHPELYRTRRWVHRGNIFGVPGSETVTYENRRPASLDALKAQALAILGGSPRIAFADTYPAPGVPLDSAGFATYLPSGHLVGVVESGKSVFYVWRPR